MRRRYSIVAGLFLPVVLFFLLNSCSENKRKQSATDKKKSSDTVKNGVVKAYYESGKVRAEITLKDGRKNGLAREYYKSGNIFQEIYYVDGIKDGVAKRFHENGKLYQSTEYVHGKMQGKQLKFRDDGKPASEAIYFQDEPCKGLVEYTLKGAPKKQYPTLVITPVNTLLKNNKYLLRLKMSDNSKSVEYFTGTLAEGGCLGDEVQKIWTPVINGSVDIEYYLPQGAFIMEKVNIIAKVKTLQGNYFITQRSYNVAIENN